MGRRFRLLPPVLVATALLPLAIAVTPQSAPAAQLAHRAHRARPALQLALMTQARAEIVAHQLPAVYVVRPGDTLWHIAADLYGLGRLWPALWWANRHHVANPSALAAGQHLAVASDPTTSAALYRRAVSAIPAAPAASAAGSNRPPSVSPPAASPVSAGAPGSFQQCVIMAESGGNPAAVNPSSGAGGLYGFLPSTWAALGFPGLPENASVAMQNQAFEELYAQQGTAPWAPYDGC